MRTPGEHVAIVDGAKNGDRPLRPRGARECGDGRGWWAPLDRVVSPHFSRRFRDG
jgi:hypothetical protein